MIERLFAAILGCSMLVACGGDGGAPVPIPPRTSTERPLPDGTNPVPPTDQRPNGNDQDPVSSPLPGSPPSQAPQGGRGNEGGSGNTDGGRGNAGGEGNPGPGGGECTIADECAGCTTACEICACAGLTADQCGCQ